MPTFRVVDRSEIEEAPRARPRLPKRAAYRRARYWTRERIVDALRNFYRANGFAPTASAEWGQHTAGGGNAPGRPYPSFQTILNEFGSLIQAWDAAGVGVIRNWEAWSPEEDWYLREAAGILTRMEIARDVRRTPEAVHRRLYDLGIDSRHCHGWSGEQIRKSAGIAQYTLQRYMLRKRIDWIVGTRSFFFQPEELVVIEEIDWAKADPALVHAVKRGHVKRIVGELDRRLRKLGSLAGEENDA
jgi:hypothetical protein